MSAYTDAQAQNDISRNVRKYRDIDLFFGKKPVSKDVNIITDIANIKRAVRNLVLTNIYEALSSRDSFWCQRYVV